MGGGDEDYQVQRNPFSQILVRQKPTSPQELMELGPTCQKVILLVSTERDIRLFLLTCACSAYQHIEVHAALQTGSVPTHSAHCPLQSSHSSLRLPSSQVPVPLEPRRFPSGFPERQPWWFGINFSPSHP